MVKIISVTTGTLAVNCYLLYDSQNNAVVIDPGDKSDKLAQIIQNKGLKVSQILLTHGHFDHIAGVAWLNKLTQAKIALSADEVPIIKEFIGFRADFYGYKVEPFEPDTFLSEDEVVQVGEIILKVIETPGHSAGGLCFYLPSEKILFTGDTLFKGAVGRVDIPSASLKSLQASLKRLFNYPAETKIYPGHGDPSSIGQETKMIQGLLT